MDRRSLLSGGGVVLAAQLLPREAGARARTSAITPDDGKFMQMAIDQAKEGDYPFGAVIVRDGRVLAFGRNSTARNSDPTAHAEMMAIRAFLNGHEPDALKETTLYSSGEPCVMCMGAIIWCGIKRLVFAASIAQLAVAHRADRHHRQADRQRHGVLQHRDRRRLHVGAGVGAFP